MRTTARFLPVPSSLKFGLLALMGIALLALVACGPSATPTSTPTATPTSQAGAATPTPTATSGAPTGSLREVPRNRTLIRVGTGTTILNPDNHNPYAVGGFARLRDWLTKTVYEFLYYYNHVTGEMIPWLATGYQYNNDFTEITINLRPGVKWADGQPFTANDVAFTLNMLKEHPSLVFSADIKDWVKEVQVIDQQTVKIVLTRPNPRWFFLYMAENAEINIPILPEHVWKDKDPETFTNFDLEKGWPLGTGPYKVVRSTSESVILDRRDSWWGSEVGFHEMPQVERFIRIPGGDAANIAVLFSTNQVDFGYPLLPGTFQSARQRNPNLIAWNKQGPIWGLGDACLYTLGLNNKIKPFDDPEIRWAINHALDRDKIINLAYEGGTIKRVWPQVTFDGPAAKYEQQVQDLLDKYDVDDFDLQKTADIMTRKGYKKDSEGFWVGTDGKRVQLTLQTGNWLSPLGPVIEKQLRDAGFDAVFKLPATGWLQGIQSGSYESWITVHCGSTGDPYQMLKDFTTAYSAPIGESTRYVWANSRYENPEYDAILAKMEMMAPSEDDPQYINLFRQAMEIWLRDLPEITIAEERHIWTLNETYWTGWPGADDPYAWPYDGADFLLIVLNLKPKQ